MTNEAKTLGDQIKAAAITFAQEGMYTSDEQVLDGVIAALVALASQPEVRCVGCEGSPAVGNSPCSVCGKQAPQPAAPAPHTDGYGPVSDDAITVEWRRAGGKVTDDGRASIKSESLFEYLRELYMKAQFAPKNCFTEPAAPAQGDLNSIQVADLWNQFMRTDEFARCKEWLKPPAHDLSTFHGTLFTVFRAGLRLAAPASAAQRDAKDAERYRWLRAGKYPHKFAVSVLNDTAFGIDAQVDTAMAASARHAGGEVGNG